MRRTTEAEKLHHECLVVDGHCDTLLRLWETRASLAQRRTEGHLDLPRMREGGVDIQVFACYIEPQYKPDRGLERALQLVDFFHQQLEACPELFLIRTAGDIARVRGEGRLGAMLAIEGGEGVGDDLSYLRTLYRLGVRLITLTWNQRNLIADGVAEERTGGGLSTFGVQVVEEMNRLGMMVDVSHLSEAGFWHVAATCRAPFVASHSCCRALCDHRRNLTDDQIRALARAGGVVGINFAPNFLREDGRATWEDVLRHIEHVISLVGPAHVGLGSDYDGIGAAPTGVEDVSRLPVLTRGMLERGFSEDDVRKILGENFLRVLEQVMDQGTAPATDQETAPATGRAPATGEVAAPAGGRDPGP
ncbi:MAG: dipeptidase [Bacillota bacterium]|nr:dipeptidase [Bacillota bacterium]